MSLRELLKSLIPAPVLKARQRRAIRQARERYAGKSAREVFSEIYASNAWGGEAGKLCSGTGSTEMHAELYGETVKTFIAEHGIRSIVDLGCGDFHVGRRFAAAAESYVGVDIVPAVVEANNKSHGSECIRFECVDAIEDPLPEGELCLIRQVFQHLSNEQIARILPKLAGFRFVLLTEHYPIESADFVPNKEKPNGPDIRCYENSAVVLDVAPFNVPATALVLSMPADASAPEDGETLRTHLFAGSAFGNPHSNS